MIGHFGLYFDMSFAVAPVVVEELYDLEGNKLESCPHPGMMCKVKVPYKVEKNSFIRKELI